MIGIDILNLNRIKLDDKFINKILSVKEKEVLNSISNIKRKIEYVASRFSCKEAIYKAVQHNDSFSDVSILNDINNKPYVMIKNTVMKNLEISISHCTDYVVCVCVNLDLISK